MKHFATALVLILGALAAIASPREEEPKIAGPGLRSVGVNAYTLAMRTDEATIKLLDHSNADIGQVFIHWTREGNREVTWTPLKGEPFSFVWSPVEGRLTFSTASATVVKQFDFSNKTFTVTPPWMENLLNDHAREIAQIAETAIEIELRVVYPRLSTDARPKLRTGKDCIYDCQPPLGTGPLQRTWDPADYGGSYAPNCNGPEVRGSAVASMSRSLICEEARKDANLQCWNSLCTGCCAFRECDAYCLLEPDYLCVMAGITGVSCSP